VSQIPERLINFNVYGGPKATAFIGVATIDLPAFESMVETISGAGIAGEISSPVLGHFTSQMVKLAFRTSTKSQIDMLAPVTQRLDIRGSIQVQDSGLGATVTTPLVVEVRGQTKNLQLGKLEPGKVMGADLDLEIAFIRVTLGGVLLVELDKLNMIFKVNGVDYLATVRRDLGGV
jgi:P2 family phage contractile tail tube protein